MCRSSIGLKACISRVYRRSIFFPAKQKPELFIFQSTISLWHDYACTFPLLNLKAVDGFSRLRPRGQSSLRS